MQGWDIPGYTGVKVLGSGGFGDVVLARHDASGAMVAIKYLHQELLSDPKFAELFRAEARVLASLDDQNVVRLYEYLESPAGAAIVMELVDGVSLREILSRQGQTTPEAALVVLQGSLLGLAAAHARGVVHRDYKPANVLVNGGGVSKLSDFGIAVRAGDRPVPAGTLAYAPPEQFGGSAASPAGDVYAATVTFYECLTGRPPFTGDSVERVVYQQLYTPVPLDTVPEPLRQLMTAGLAKDPADRPADAAAFVTTLRAVAAGAYGEDWEERGRSRLAAAALLLAALWPSGGAPAVAGSAVQQVHLAGPHPGQVRKPSSGQVRKPSSEQTRESRHLLHLKHLAHLRHLRVILALSGAAAVAAVGLVIAAPWKAAAACSLKLSTVGAFEAAAAQTVEIDGCGFGTGNTTSGADSAYFRVSDLTAGWNACSTRDPGTDSVTCDLSSWTNGTIIFSGFAGDYGQYTWTVAKGDKIEIQVWNPQSGKGPKTCEVVAGGSGSTAC
jgi:serine/threonine protein kinase